MPYADKEKHKAVVRANTRAYRLRDPEGQRRKERNTFLIRTYGITLIEYEARLKAQGDCCKICKSIEARAKHGTFVVDHNHKTGKVRGILCNSCNSMLGNAQDDPLHLKLGAAYLEDEGHASQTHP